MQWLAELWQLLDSTHDILLECRASIDGAYHLAVTTVRLLVRLDLSFLG